MNLVAKEYVAAQAPNNPGVEATAAAIARAFSMQLDERKDRWHAMMAVLSANSVHDLATMPVLGHSVPGVTARYAHMCPTRLSFRPPHPSPCMGAADTAHGWGAPPNSGKEATCWPTVKLYSPRYQLIVGFEYSRFYLCGPGLGPAYAACLARWAGRQNRQKPA
jgi:hypothetical protein